MPYTTDQLQNIVEETDHWTILNEQNFLSHGGLNREPCAVSVCDLAKLHPDYPTALRGMIDLAYEPAIDTTEYANVAGHAAQHTLEYLVKPGVWMLSENGSKDLFHRIEQINDCPGDAENTMVSGLLFILDNLGASYNHLKVVTTSCPAKLRVPIECLNTTYPGWQARWKIGLELGLGYPDLQQHTFSDASPHTTTGTPTLEDLRFD